MRDNEGLTPCNCHLIKKEISLYNILLQNSFNFRFIPKQQHIKINVSVYNDWKNSETDIIAKQGKIYTIEFQILESLILNCQM